MCKTILGLTVIAAIATPLAFASSANAATFDANGAVLTVAKADVMTQFPGMNEAAFQTIAMAEGQSLTGSEATTFTTETVWGCSDGSLQHHFWRSTRTTPSAFTEVYNKSADKVTGWTVGGKGASTWTENNTGGTRFPTFTCPAGSSPDFSRYSVLTPTVSETPLTVTFGGQPVTLPSAPEVLA